MLIPILRQRGRQEPADLPDEGTYGRCDGLRRITAHPRFANACEESDPELAGMGGFRNSRIARRIRQVCTVTFRLVKTWWNIMAVLRCCCERSAWHRPPGATFPEKSP